MPLPNIGGTSDGLQRAATLPVSSGTGNPARTRSDAPVVPDASPVPQQQQSSQAIVQSNTKQLNAAMDKLRQAAEVSSSSLSFSVDNDTGKTIVKVTDQATGHLIRQIPSQEVIELANSINQMQGILFNKKV